jgi:hypothetical protein
MCARNALAACSAVSVVLWLAGNASAPAASIDVNFDDGTTGALNAQVNVSSRPLTTAVTSDVHAPPVSGQAWYALSAYGSPGQDKAVIDTAQSFSSVVVSDVVTLYGTGYSGGGGGVVAGMPAAGGSGYLLYLAQTWSNGGGAWWDSTVGGTWQLVLVKMLAGSATPLAAGDVYQAVQVAGVTQGLPDFVQLSVNGNAITGQVWVGQTSVAGAQTATVSLTDASPLSGYAGAFLAGRNLQCPYTTNYGVASVDNFTAAVAPEPATLALLALGGLLIRRRSR